MALPDLQNIRPLNIAIILAGGSGRRAASNLAQKQAPKQFWPLAGLPLWQHSWLRYATHSAIDKVCMVWPKTYLEPIRAAIAAHPEPTTSTYVIAGGQERSDSSYRAVEFCQQWQTPLRRVQVLIHDAARPLVSARIIDDTLSQLQSANAVVCAVPTQDSLFVKDPSNKVEKILDRSGIMHSQTPQSFELQTLRQAFALHQQRQEIRVTDDISLVKHYLPSLSIHIVLGESYNAKLTEAVDLYRLISYYKMIKTNK